MARTIGDCSLSNVQGAQDNLKIGFVEINIGATGAVGSQIAGPPGVTFTRTGAGTYTVVYPAAVAGGLIPYVAKSAAPTVFDCSITAKNVAAGTATLVFANAAGTATDPANGDIIGLMFLWKASAPANA